MDSTNVINPPLGAIDRTLRLINEDGDPATPPVPADGTSGRPYYKQTDGAVFDRPFRGSLADTLLGTEDGPDMRVDHEGSAAARVFLDDLSRELLDEFPAGDKGQYARIRRIDVFEPPYVPSGGTWTRYGMATVEVTAGIHQDHADGTERLLAERSVRFVLNEVSYAAQVHGPLYACKDIFWTHAPLGVHWGRAMAGDDAHLADHTTWTVSLPRAVPTSLDADLLWAYDDTSGVLWDSYYRDNVMADGFRIEDPWFRLLVYDDLKQGESTPLDPTESAQPWPFDWDLTSTVEDGHVTAPDDPLFDPPLQPNHSNLFQKMESLVPRCDDSPPFPYDIWKTVAVQGGPGIHYYVWASGSEFRENGAGEPKEFRDLTNGKTGFFFFDTRDGNAPLADGSNLTPPIELAGGTWGVRGLVYLNSRRFHAHDVVGPSRPFRSPGEPFQDLDADGVHDAGEYWVNLELTAPPTYNASADDAFGGGGSVVRNDRGPEEWKPAMIWGVLYNRGDFDSTGTGNYYGAVVAGESVVEGSAVMDSPHIYWDADLERDWPPPEWGLPRVLVTRWETDL
jgi:hypothetical protein